MKTYDLIIIGTGSGVTVAEYAVQNGKSVAIIDRGPTGGTCLNTGCVPSKHIIESANRVMQIQEAEKLGISVSISKIDYKRIITETKAYVEKIHTDIHETLLSSEHIDFYPVEGTFVDADIIQVGDAQIRGKEFVIAAGTRPLIPEITGTTDKDWHTTDTMLSIENCPKKMLILGGGYIGCEYAHFFSAMGAEVILVEAGETIISQEDADVQETLTAALRKRMTILTESTVKEIWKTDSTYTVAVSDGKQIEDIDVLFAAVGRTPNTDTLDLKKVNVTLSPKGFIEVNDFLQSSNEKIWACGDIIGKNPFLHAAQREASFIGNNMFHEKQPIDDSSVPHGIFSYPEIASVGMTEEAAKKSHKVLIGKGFYKDTTKGTALKEEDSFVKMIFDAEKHTLLGAHVIGSFATTVIQEIINVIGEGRVDTVLRGTRIHPALSEVIHAAIANLHEL
jgi:mycothione reductase